MRNLAFLASPYYHPDAERRLVRYNAALAAARWLWDNGWFVYSPIVYGKTLHAEGEGRQSHLWAIFNYRLIDCCDDLIVLAMDGWTKSIGIADEMAYAKATHKPIYFLLRNPGEDYRLNSRPY